MNWKERSKWVCFFLVVISVIAETANFILVTYKQNTLIVSNLYILFDSLLIYYFFYWNFKRYSLYQNLIVGLLLILLIVWTNNNVIKENIWNLDSWSNGIETLSVIILSIIFFYNQIIKPQTLFVYSTPIFWIVAGILIYKSGTFFLFLYFDTLEHSEKEDFKSLYVINSAFLFIRNIFFAIAFTLKRKALKKTNLQTAI